MSTRKIKDAKDLETGEKIYLKGHARATYMSDGSTVEDAIASKIGKEEAANTYATKEEVPTDYLGFESVGEDVEDSVEYLTTSKQTFSDEEKEIIKSNIGVNVPIVEHGTSDSTFALTPNKYHRWGTMASLTLTLASPNDTSVVNNYAFEFTSGNTATTLLVPSDIQWVNDVTVEANMRYQGIINSGIGALVSVINE